MLITKHKVKIMEIMTNQQIHFIYNSIERSVVKYQLLKSMLRGSIMVMLVE